MERLRRVRLLCLGWTSLLLVACGGGGGGNTPPPPTGGPPPPPVSTQTLIETPSAAVRFLSWSTFGGTKAQIDALTGMDAADWLKLEFSRPPTYTLPKLASAPRDQDGQIERWTASGQYWDQMFTAPDQLRQRMAFALSQILVYSDITNLSEQAKRAYYQDILIEHAFGNYRDLLQDVTYSPAMSQWLTYYRNRKGDPNTGRMPDENYARELLQLFTLGLVELNPDGTVATGANEIFDNEDIVGLARVFTGLSGKGLQFWGVPDEDYIYNPLVMFEDQHSTLEKSFLGTTIPPNTSGTESINIALDTIFEHPNLAPFVSRQLIQRLTRSDPPPEYVGRVAAAFEAGRYQSENGQIFGDRRRGNLEATLAAILLDESLFTEPASLSAAEQTGKIREPILRFAHFIRAFDHTNIISLNEWRLVNTTDPATGLGQHPFRSPSVFNFYRPGYIAPNSQSGELGLTAPEFQIMNQSSAIGYHNFTSEFAFNFSPQRDGQLESFIPNYDDELSLVDTPADLVDHLALLLTADQLSVPEREAITAILETLPVETGDPAAEAFDRFQKVATAVALVINSPSFAVIW